MVEGRVVIAGAGIGGLCLAHALKRGGLDVFVLERSSQGGPPSSGLVLQAATMEALRAVGLAEQVRAAGQVVERAELLTWRGQVLASVSSNANEPGVRSENVAIHGARFREVLVDAVGADRIQYGFRVATYDESPDSVTVIADDGRRVEGAVLVGADGIWSRIRSRLVGDDPPEYAGYTSWRGVAEAADLVPLGSSSESWGQGQRFGVVSIGGGEAYWFALVNARPGERDDPNPIEGLCESFRTWHRPIERLLARTQNEDVRRSDVHYRRPIRRWGDGRVVLLGDAAHPMTPNLADGAGQAIEDAAALSVALVRHGAIIAAFRDYEAARVDRANLLARRSRSYDEVARWRHPLPQLLRDAALRLAPARLGPYVVFGT